MDRFKRIIFIKHEFKRNLLKSLKVNQKIPYSIRYKAAFYLSTKPRFSSLNYSSKRCIVSGRVWGVEKVTGLTRFVFREEANNSSLPGCSRAS
jgi:ribosomal protein S14